jgi:hypothetical protein
VPARDLAHLVDEVGRRSVVDHVMGAEVRQSATFSAPPAVAMTRAPAARPSCTADDPTPPAPPCTSNHSPACNTPRSCSANHVVP